MSKFIIDIEPKIRKIIDGGLAEILDATYCHEFNDLVSQKYKWFPTRINWEETGVKTSVLEWNKCTQIEVRSYIMDTSLKNFDYVGIIYSARQPGLVLDLKVAIDKLGSLSSDYGFKYGVHFIVGARKNAFGILTIDNSCFIEVDDKYLISPATVSL